MRSSNLIDVKRLGIVGAALVASVLALSACASNSTVTPGDTSTPTVTPTDSSSAPASPSDSTTPDFSVLITMDTPTDGQTVTGGDLTVSGTANSPEANVPWTIEDAQGSVVDHGFFTADGWMDKLYPYKGTIDVSAYEPGTYMLTVKVDDLSDGEGDAPQKVTRTFVVQ